MAPENNKIEKKKSLLKNQKGFTMIEIMIVSIILAIIAAIAIPVYQSYIADGYMQEGVLGCDQWANVASAKLQLGKNVPATSPVASTNFGFVVTAGTRTCVAAGNSTGTPVPADTITVVLNASGTLKTWTGAGIFADSF